MNVLVYIIVPSARYFLTYEMAYKDLNHRALFSLPCPFDVSFALSTRLEDLLFLIKSLLFLCDHYSIYLFRSKQFGRFRKGKKISIFYYNKVQVFLYPEKKNQVFFTHMNYFNCGYKVSSQQFNPK